MKEILFILVLLLLVACNADNTLQAVVLEDGQDDIPEPVKEAKDDAQDESREDTSEESREDPEENRPEEFKDVTEVKTYDVKGKCIRDSKGVVRYFDEDGKKTVYRNECDFGFLITYDCDGNTVSSETKTCSGTCTQGTYGDTCK